MDSNTTPSQQLAKHITANSGQSAGSSFSHIFDNPFFSAVRTNSIITRLGGWIADSHRRALGSRRLVLRRVPVRRGFNMALHLFDGACSLIWR
jgi:hypothetical protein